MSRTATYRYDDAQLQELFKQLDVKQQVKAMKGAFSREARNFRKKVVNTLTSTPGGRRGRPLAIEDYDAERQIRARVFKKVMGFQVTLKPKRKTRYGYHHNRRGQDLPILLWAEGGTKERRTKTNSGKHNRTWTWRLRARHKTGAMPAYRFMSITRDREKDNVTASLHNEIRKYVTNAAKRNGCTI